MRAAPPRTCDRAIFSGGLGAHVLVTGVRLLWSDALPARLTDQGVTVRF